MADIIEQFKEIVNSKNNMKMEEKKTFNAATLGLGFHQFNGTESAIDVLNAIGGNFNVECQSLARLPKVIVDAIKNGESVTIDPRYLIDSHKANVCSEYDDTIGIVGKDYGVVQNNVVCDMLDLMCNASVTDTPMHIVSAGRVRNYDLYMQAELPMIGRINGDNSDTKFYVFVRNSHDGTCGVQVRLSPTRVICQNTFMMNVSSKNGINYKHSKNVGERVDFTKEENIRKVQDVLRKTKIMSEEYIEKMNSYALAKVSDKDIEEYVLKLFVDEEKLRNEARQHNYNLDLTDISTKTKNVIESFRNTLESGVGQDTNRGTKLWLFNGTTNYLSNIASYGNKSKDNATEIATKRFTSIEEGGASKKIEKAISLLA